MSSFLYLNHMLFKNQYDKFFQAFSLMYLILKVQCVAKM
jgi:hypothetical protein